LSGHKKDRERKKKKRNRSWFGGNKDLKLVAREGIECAKTDFETEARRGEQVTANWTCYNGH